MNLKIDYFFSYKNTLRFALIQKINLIQNVYNVPRINKLILYFFFNKLEDLNHNELYNSFYLLNTFLVKKHFLPKLILFIR